MPNSSASRTSSSTSATRSTAFAGMQATFRQRPPTTSLSMTAVFMPSWAARIAATYPPGPEPMTTQSYWESAMRRPNLTNALWRLDPAHDPDELPEQPTGHADDRHADHDGEHVGGAQQEEREEEHDQPEQRLEAQHGPIARQPQPAGGDVHDHAEG